MKLKFCLLLVFFPIFLSSQIVYVTPEGAGLKDGTSWENAMEGIQYAFDNAPATSEVWIKKGTYFISGIIHLDGKPLKLYGGFNGNELFRNQRDFYNNKTIITDIDLIPNFRIENIIYDSFILDGFTTNIGVNNCNNVIISNCNLGPSFVSGIFKLTINNNIFDGALFDGDSGGVIYIDSYYENNTYSELYIINNLFNNLGSSASCALDIQLQKLKSGQKVYIINNTICNNEKTDDFVNNAVGISLLLEDENITGTLSVKNNLFYNNKFNGVTSHTNIQSYLRYCAWDGNTATGTNKNLTTSPFVSSSDFSLLSNSICINSGTPDTTGLFLSKVDLAGNPRIYDNRIDIGAYEYQPNIANYLFFGTCVNNSTSFLLTNTTNIQSVVWDFGDTKTSSETNPIHSYINTGNYTVTLTVTYTNGSTQTVTKEIKINESPSILTIEHN